MSWGFEPGRVYNRRADIHARFDGQQQGGIITPSLHPVVIIITGEEGAAHGYADRQRPDGVFEYFGEGQIGDMQVRAGNKAIAQHSADGKSLLLFRKINAGLQFIAEMVYETHRIRRAPDREKVERDAIVFELRRLEAVVERAESEPHQAAAGSLDDLRKRALEAAAASGNDPKKSTGNVYERSRAVRDFVLARAGPDCEGCETPAPFLRPNGSPYLEPHHIRRRSDGGPDHPAFVIALCPTCHRRVHFGADGGGYNSELLAKMATIEPKIPV